MAPIDTQTEPAPPRVRADKARNRERILVAAREAFSAHGTETQMGDVATRAGVGVGTVYRHFPTKEALMGEMVRQKFALIAEHAREGLEEDGEPFEVFASVLYRNCEATAHDAAAQDALMRAAEHVWDQAQDVLDEMHGLVQQLIDRAQAAGTMRQDFSVDDMGMLMCGVSASMAHSEWDWRRHLALLLDGLRTQPTPSAP
ncbi:helix-turn-helix domain-containing protein [Paraconexibacter sp. AEG42_29]